MTNKQNNKVEFISKAPFISLVTICCFKYILETTHPMIIPLSAIVVIIYFLKSFQ